MVCQRLRLEGLCRSVQVTSGARWTFTPDPRVRTQSGANPTKCGLLLLRRTFDVLRLPKVDPHTLCARHGVGESAKLTGFILAFCFDDVVLGVVGVAQERHVYFKWGSPRELLNMLMGRLKPELCYTMSSQSLLVAQILVGEIWYFTFRSHLSWLSRFWSVRSLTISCAFVMSTSMLGFLASRIVQLLGQMLIVVSEA